MITDKLIEIASIVGVPLKKLSKQTIKKVNGAPQGQERTAERKKPVKILNDLVFKGPYTSDKDYFRLMENLRYTYAIQLLEAALKLPEWKRGSLQWEYLGCWVDDTYYLVVTNVGKHENIHCIPANKSGFNPNAMIIPRKIHVMRVSEIENNGQLTNEIKLATLQHLYFRFLFDIGDSGTHNILIRRDTDSTDRLIAGIDLEEKITDNVEIRRSKVKKRCLDLLFSREPFKKHIDLYQSDVRKIKSLSYSQLDQHTLDSLDTVGIDLERLKVNMDRW